MHLYIYVYSCCGRVWRKAMVLCFLQLSLPVNIVRFRHNTWTVEALGTNFVSLAEEIGRGQKSRRYACYTDITPDWTPSLTGPRMVLFFFSALTPTHPSKPRLKSPPFWNVFTPWLDRWELFSLDVHLGDTRSHTGGGKNSSWAPKMPAPGDTPYNALCLSVGMAGEADGTVTPLIGSRYVRWLGDILTPTCWVSEQRTQTLHPQELWDTCVLT